ncbi:MAG: NTP transferase domain-containing protein [Anaerolineales bacterium]|nr:NTP transferase domain-containing protein [Anaerolineales bacterium]
MDAIITAGGIPKPEDLLYPYTQGESKARMQIGGKPMIQWILDAVSQAKTIESVVLVGLDADSGLNCTKPLSFVPNQGSRLDNVRTGIKEVVARNPQAVYALVISSDIPAITGEMIDWSVNTSLETEHDLYYSVITREVMEKRYPGSRRSFIRLKDLEVCGADMNMIHTSIVTGRDEFWNKLIAARKNALKQAALIGYDTLILLLLRRLTIEKMIELVAKRFDLRGRALLCPYAEVGMDVDKPYQFEILQTDLEGRAQV